MYYNQNDYGQVPYPYPGDPKNTHNRTIKTSGCGPVAMAMVLTELGIDSDPIDMARLAQKCGARQSLGTHMQTLAKAVQAEYSDKITCTTTGDSQQLRRQLLEGAKAIAYIAGNSPGYTGLFSTGGHFVAVVEADGDQVIVWDADYRRGKYDTAGRKGRLQYTWPNPDLRVSIDVLHRDCRGKVPNYFIFKRIGEEDKPMTKSKVEVAGVDVPSYLIDDKNYVELRPMVEAINRALGLAVTWTPEDGAGIKIGEVD